MPEQHGKPGKTRGVAASVGICVLVGVAYFVTGFLGLRFNAVSGFATLVWPPSGIALATLLLLGYEFWPAIAIGAFATNFVTGAPVLVALGIAAGNTLEAVVGTYLLRRADFSPKIDKVRHALAFIGYAALASTLVSATVGVTSLFLGDVVPWSDVFQTWIAWWVGDMLGVLVFGALLIVLIADGRKALRLTASVEWLALCTALLLTAFFVFLSPFGGMSVEYLVFLPLLWAALRFEQVGTVIATFIIMVIAIWATSIGSGPFYGPEVSVSLIFLQIFMGTVAATKLLVSSVQSERHAALEEVRDFNRNLERKVTARTLEMAQANEGLKRSDAALIERHSVLQAVLSGIGEGVIAIDMVGNPIVVNPAARNILGLSIQDGSPSMEKLYAVTPASYPDGKTEVPSEDRPLARALRGESTENERLLIKSTKYPKGVLVSSTGTPINDDKGKRIGGVAVFREIPK